MLDLKIATPQTVMNFADFLQSNNFYEESFRVYERAIAQMFGWPHCYEIWVGYLEKIIEKYAEKKSERIRDLFEQVLKTVPKEVINYHCEFV